jgi:hypothetical protein
MLLVAAGVMVSIVAVTVLGVLLLLWILKARATKEA